MPDFYVDDDGKVWVEYKKDGSYTDPSTVTLTAYAPDGTKKYDAVSMTQSATGKYYYYANLDTAGRWVFYIVCTDASSHTQTDRFEHNVSKKVTP